MEYLRNDEELERIRLGLAAFDRELPKLRAIAAPVITEELAPIQRQYGVTIRSGGVGWPSVRRDGRLRPLSSGIDERESARTVSGLLFGILLGGVCWVAIIAALWWLSRQPADVIVRLLAGGFLILGSVLIGYGLAWMEKRGG